MHWSYKPCKNYQTDSCSASPCRFNHSKLQSNQEICYKCGKVFSSKAEIITHIKTTHGDRVCYKFTQNKCDRSSEECLYNHNLSNHKTFQSSTQSPTNIQQNQQVFQERHNMPHSPGVGMPTMSEHIQNQQQIHKSQEMAQLPVNILNMIPQIVYQIVTALTMQRNQ